MNKTELKDFLYQEIPLSRFMQLEITQADEWQVEIIAPLDPSRNHLDTAFGGSIGAILILSCYAWLFHRLKSLGLDCHVLIKAGNTDYLMPIHEDLKAICQAPATADYEKFLSTFERRGLAQITLKAFMQTSQGKAASFQGVFVAQKSKA